MTDSEMAELERGLRKVMAHFKESDTTAALYYCYIALLRDNDFNADTVVRKITEAGQTYYRSLAVPLRTSPAPLHPSSPGGYPFPVASPSAPIYHPSFYSLSFPPPHFLCPPPHEPPLFWAQGSPALPLEGGRVSGDSRGSVELKEEEEALPLSGAMLLPHLPRPRPAQHHPIFSRDYRETAANA